MPVPTSNCNPKKNQLNQCIYSAAGMTTTSQIWTVAIDGKMQGICYKQAFKMINRYTSLSFDYVRLI